MIEHLSMVTGSVESCPAWSFPRLAHQDGVIARVEEFAKE
jgi:hypothetical protein